MGTNVLIAAFVKYQTGYYGYSHPGETGHTGFVNGQPLVDCSRLVYDGLIGAGYTLPWSASNFSTHTLFNGDSFTNGAASYFQPPILPADVAQRNGSLQMGDIICFRSNNPDHYENGQPVYEQHVGIFYGYDPQTGYPIFYGSQGNGPATATIRDSLSYWNGGTETIVGALRPKDSIYNPQYDTTTNITSDIGYGKNIPGQTSDPTAQYRKVLGLNGNVMLLYTSGEIFTYATTIENGVVTTRSETWRIPDQNGGAATTITRDIYNPGTPQASYGPWYSAGGIVAATQYLVALNGGVNSVNPFLDPATAQAFALAEATGSTPPSLTQQAVDVALGNISAITLYASATSTTDQTIRLTLNGGASANKYVCTGADMIAFNGGTATVTIPAGQDHVTITLVDTANQNSADTFSLSATLVDPNAPAGSAPVVSNVFKVTFDSPNPFAAGSTAPVPPVTPDYTYNGAFALKNFGTAANPVYQYDSANNLVLDPSQPMPNQGAHINGTTVTLSSDTNETGTVYGVAQRRWRSRAANDGMWRMVA